MMSDMTEARCRNITGDVLKDVLRDVLRDVTTSVVSGVNSLIPEEKRKVEEVCHPQD